MHACGYDMHTTWLLGAAKSDDRQPRETSPTEQAVVTIGSVTAGTKYNVIPDEALLKVNVRSFDENTRTKIKDAIKRIAVA